MSLEMKSVHVRLDAEAHAALHLVATACGYSLGEAARVLLTEALLGRVANRRKALVEQSTPPPRTRR